MAQVAYWVIGPSSGWTDPTGSEIKLGQLSGGGAATAAGSETAPGSGSGTIPEATAASGLTAGTAYKVAWVVYDNVALTYSNVVVSAAFTTGTMADVGLAAETDTALALSALQIAAAGRADETDTALALTSGASAPVGTAAETDTALALSTVQITAAGIAFETDAALALDASTPGVVGAAFETDTALALVGAQIVPVGVAVESSASLALAAVQAITAGMALEIDSGLSLTGSQLRTVGRADEIDAALSLSAGSGGTASAADVWSYVLSNGLTAEQTLVAVHTWLSELHLIHGLTAGSPLSVTSVARTAGAVSQAVAEAAGTVTVTRQ